MSRPDLLALTDEVLADLTNKGTLRRARKELAKASFTVSQAEDGTLTISADDDTSCVLFANRPFSEWTCTCLAATNCRHIVRAVLHYQSSHDDGAAETSPQSASEPDHSPSEFPTEPQAETQSAAEANPGVLAPESSERTFDPASLSREVLATRLSPAALRRADEIAAAGLLAHIGQVRGVTVVRIHHPTPVSVRFLLGADLNYVRCTCRDPDPCVHVAVAARAAEGRPFGETGLRATPGDRWQPDSKIIGSVRQAALELIRVGAEAGHRQLRGVWHRLVARARQAQLHHVADLLEELLDELARYESRSQQFTPSRLTDLTAELLARCACLVNPDPDRIPDRLVAGSPAEDTRVAKARLIGMGTQFTEVDDDCRLVAYLVDARSGAPMRVTKRVTDDQFRPSWRLAGGLVSGISIASWGGGQVMSLGGRMFGHGDFAHTNRSAVGLPAGAIDQLDAPFRVETIAELATQQTRLPAVLDDRSAGTDLAACRVTGISDLHLDPGLVSLVATLLDGDGVSFQLALPISPRREASAQATWVRLRSWLERFPEVAYVAGRWRWAAQRAVVDPLLLVGDGVPFQPHIAQPAANTASWQVKRDTVAVTSPGALLLELDRLLGELLVAGVDRIRLRPDSWRQFVTQARRAGSQIIADHAEAFLNSNSPTQAEELLLLAAFGRALA